MLRRHFLNSSTIDDNCIITYTTLNGDIFDMEAIQKHIQQIIQSLHGSVLSIYPKIISNTYTTYGKIIFSHPVTEIGFNYYSSILPIFYNFQSILPDSKKQLTTVTLPPSVITIKDAAFQECSYLTSITIPNSVTSIGDSAFRGCSSLTSVTIPNSVTSIEGGAFLDCSSLTSIEIPNSVISIGRGAFENCSSLTKTNYTGDVASWCNIKFDDIYANPIYLSHNFYINDQEIKNLVIPNSVMSIGDYLFIGCSPLTSVTIPNSITSIGKYAFYGCSSLTSITIPNSVTSIGEYAFSSCSLLNTINFENTVEQWNAITKGIYWNDNVPATVVHCTDGDIQL